jgi:hypothetical protein
MDRSQLHDRIRIKHGEESIGWQMIEDAFGRAGDLGGKNSAMYRRLKAERDAPDGKESANSLM